MCDVAQLKLDFDRVRSELAKAVVDQEHAVEMLLIAVLAGGHCLVESSPGAGRSLIARALADVCGLQFSCVRCTPDLQVDELVGAGPDVPSAHRQLVSGPLSAHLVLVDDLTRLPPKPHALLQQAIEGEELVVGDREYTLPQPMMVLATTYSDDDQLESVPQPQDDRFMFKLVLPYPSYETEYRLATALTGPDQQQPQRVLSAEELLQYQQAVLQIDSPPPVIHYAVRLARATRVHEGETPDFVYEWIQAGAGSRAVHFLTWAAKIRSALYGRPVATSEDVRQVAHAVLRHRIFTNRNARENGVSVDRVIDRLLYEIPERAAGDDQPPSAEGD